MAERSIIDQLDDAIAALLAECEPVVFDPELAELVVVGRALRGMPSEQFRAALKEQLGGKQMKAKTQPKKFKPEGFHTVTPYIIAKPAVELIDFVKQAFGAVENFRSTGSAGGLHCEVKIGDS